GGTGQTWRSVDEALYRGQRGLSGGSSLPQLLAQHRGVRNHLQAPRLTIQQILAWADLHFRRTGKWPTKNSGPVEDTPGETWLAINTALARKLRGLRVRSSLARLLDQYRRRAKL